MAAAHGGLRRGGEDEERASARWPRRDRRARAITRTIIGLREELKRTLTWDEGSEMAEQARLKIGAGLDIDLRDPQSPWQRPTSENTNGLLRQHFPQGTDLSAHGGNGIAAVVVALP